MQEEYFLFLPRFLARKEERKEERIPGGRLARVDTSIASGEVSKG